jgi:hypothetical protein
VRRVVVVVVLLMATAGCSWVGSNPIQHTTPKATVSATATVPNVVGLNAAVAVDTLKKQGFGNIDLGTVDGRPFVLLPQNWTVKTQSAPAGSSVRTDTKIVLGCARNG